jgi:hypothetical protein
VRACLNACMRVRAARFGMQRVHARMNMPGSPNNTPHTPNFKLTTNPRTPPSPNSHHQPITHSPTHPPPPPTYTTRLPSPPMPPQIPPPPQIYDTYGEEGLKAGMAEDDGGGAPGGAGGPFGPGGMPEGFAVRVFAFFGFRVLVCVCGCCVLDRGGGGGGVAFWLE